MASEKTDMWRVLHHPRRDRVTFIGTSVDCLFVCCAGAGVLAMGSTP